MQQFFYEEPLFLSSSYLLSSDINYQLKKVLRVDNGYKFRLVDCNQNVFLCSYNDGLAYTELKLDENNELETNITAIISLIKNDKFDFAVQKLTELGVNRIVPYIARRSVVKPGKGNNKLDRIKKIAREASEQSHRNKVPEICDYATFKDLKKYKSDLNLLAYEKETKSISDLKKYKSITYIIGPEGGFEPQEVEDIANCGFDSISLGKRILRAETAAIFLTSVIVGNEI